MKILSNESGQKSLGLCKEQLSPDCIDKNVTEAKAMLIATAFDIDNISSCICEKCYKLLQMDEDGGR